jgi:hypothetical protein
MKIRPVLVLAGCVLAVRADAATRTAASCSLTNVQSAINAASAGDTVVVPAGTCTWSAQARISKSLTIQGAGIDATVIVSHGFDIDAGVNDHRITGFTFNGAWGSNYIIAHSQSRTGNKRFRIDHNKFLNKNYTTSGTVVFHGFSYGVLDHNIFQDTGRWQRLGRHWSGGTRTAPSSSRTTSSL